MRRYALCLILGAALGLLSPAGTAQATPYYWDPDCNATGNATDGTNIGGTGVWRTTTPAIKPWWDGVSASDVAYPGSSSNYVDVEFMGTAGTVTVSGSTYAGAVNFEVPLYTLTLAGGGAHFHFKSLGGASLDCISISSAGSTTNIDMDGATPTTMRGTVSIGNLSKYGAGLLVLNPKTLTGTNNSILAYEGGLNLEGTAISITSNSAVGVYDTSNTQAVLGGGATFTCRQWNVYAKGTTVGTTSAAVVSPGSDTGSATYGGIRTNGIGVMSATFTGGSAAPGSLQFYGATSSFPDCASILVMDIKGNAGAGAANGYDQIAILGTGNGNNNPCVNLCAGAGNTKGAKLLLNWDQANYAGSRGDYLKLINVTMTTTTVPQISNKFQNASNADINNFDAVKFTNNAGKGFLFQYRYNFDVSGTQNDFGLYDNETLVTNAGGAYTNVGASSINLNGSATLDSGISGSSITAYNWDFDNNGTTDLTGQTPSVNKAYFTSTFGWGDGSAHNIVLNTLDSNGVSSWGAATLTLDSGAAPEPATWALLGTGALIAVGFVRRKRMK